MLILDGTIGSDVSAFLARMHEENSSCTVVMYENWLPTSLKLRKASNNHISCNDHDHDRPDGIIYLRVSPEIAYARIQKRALETESSISLEHIKQIYAEKEQLFIENKNSPKEFEHLPILVLNGNIDFQTDFAQFYNHLFYIKRFIKQIQDKKDLALGIYKEKTHHRHCC